METSSSVPKKRRFTAKWPLFIALSATVSAYDRLSGIVTVAETGAPVPGARVVGLTSGRVAMTDSSGRFALNAFRVPLDSTPLAWGLTGGYRLVLNGNGERFEWYFPDGTRRMLGHAPASLGLNKLPRDIGWILSRSAQGERHWVAARIGNRLMIRELSGTHSVNTSSPVDDPESLSVRWRGRTHRTIPAGADLAGPVNLPRLRFVAGDFHTHTFLSDGSLTLDDIAAHAFGGTWKIRGGNGETIVDSTAVGFGLDWFANTDHGGAFGTDRFGRSLAYLPDTAFKGISIGDYMWRWQSLRDLSWPAVDSLRGVYRDRHVFQGLEWNVPTHEHASVGILANHPDPIARFEFFFDDADTDTVGGPWPDASQKMRTSSHDKALAGARWLREHHRDSSWIVINHPSRLRRTSLQDLRDFHDAAGPVFLGIEAIPGHQKAVSRGIYSYAPPYPDDPTSARTYGGVDPYLARVGGVMDSLWSEGRNVWIFANSDCHNVLGNDHYPGLYSKNITQVSDKSESGILSGLRSGATVAVMGDLIDSFSLEIDDGARTASMGQTLATSRDSLEILVRIHIPTRSALGHVPSVDHLDLIRGYSSNRISDMTNSAIASVVASAPVGPASKAPDGWHEFVWRVSASRPGFFRIRGSSMSKGVPGWTDSLGNPLCDELQYPNDETKARSNLWFYSNPVFLRRR